MTGYWTGKHLSVEHRKKLSLAKKGKHLGAEHHNFGKHLSAETRKKLSEAHIGKIVSEKTRAKLSEKFSGCNNPMYGRNHTDTTKKKISDALKASNPSSRVKLYWQNPEYRLNHVLGVVDSWKKPERLRKHLKLHVGSKRPEDTGKKISVALLRAYENNGGYPEPKYDDGFGNKLRTKLEVSVALWLQNLAISNKLPTFDDGCPYKYEQPIEINGFYLFPDFTLAVTPTVRIEASGSAFPKWLQVTINRAKTIKGRYPKDNYVIITYKNKIQSFPKETYDKIFAVEEIDGVEKIFD